MNKLFVPYKESLQLNDLGYNQKCLGWYEGKPQTLNLTNVVQNPTHVITNALLYQQAFDWILEKYKLDYQLYPYSNGTYEWLIWLLDKPLNDSFENIIGLHYEPFFYKNKHEAQLSCLQKMIELIKNKNKPTLHLYE